MKVLFVNRMAGLQRGGGETFDLEISAALGKLGVEVSYLAAAPLFGAVPQPIRHPRVHYLRAPYLPWFPWDKVSGGWRIRIWEFQVFERKAARWIASRADEFDIIQVCELPYLVSLLKSEIRNPKSKIVMRLTAPNAHDPWGGVKASDAVMASGTSIEKIRTSVHPDVHDIPNGVNLERFSCTAAGDGLSFRRKHDIPPDAPLLLYVARFQKFKNHAVLIEAFRKIIEDVPGARLVLAGSGPLLKDTEAAVRKAGLSSCVLFLGETPFENLPDIYAAADIKVISSEYESFCFAAIEAMAAGKPLVTTDCGWVPGLIGDTTQPVQYQWADEREDPDRFGDHEAGRRFRQVPGGLVVMRGDVESLVNAMLAMIRDPAMRASCGNWNRAKATREHGWESSAKKLINVYEKLVGK